MDEDPLDELERDARTRLIGCYTGPSGIALVDLEHVIDALRLRALECEANAQEADSKGDTFAAGVWTGAHGELQGRADAFAAALLEFRESG